MKVYNGAEDSEILLIRPGATEFDEQGRIIGTLDVPLSKLGIRQASEVAHSTNQYDIKAVFSSPTTAAQQTAELIAKQHNCRVKVKDALTNVDMGLWQGKVIEELEATQPKIARQWKEHPESICPPEGESFEEVVPRVQKFLKKLQKKHKTGTIVIVVADPLAKVISSQLTDYVEPETSAGQNSPVQMAGCAKMDLLPLSVESADA